MPVTQQDVLRTLGPAFTRHGFYMGGGTAVAIQLGHRRSIDFDWFSPTPLGDMLALATTVRSWGIPLTVGTVARGTLHGEVASVRVSVIEYLYPTLRDPVVWPSFDCRLASLEDLACMKLSAITNRGARKDFVDVYALGVASQTLPEMLRAYQRRYGIDDLGHVVYGLSYFDDAEQEAMPEMLWDVSWETIRRTIERWLLRI